MLNFIKIADIILWKKYCSFFPLLYHSCLYVSTVVQGLEPIFVSVSCLYDCASFQVTLLLHLDVKDVFYMLSSVFVYLYFTPKTICKDWYKSCQKRCDQNSYQDETTSIHDWHIFNTTVQNLLTFCRVYTFQGYPVSQLVNGCKRGVTIMLSSGGSIWTSFFSYGHYVCIGRHNIMSSLFYCDIARGKC